MNVHSESHHISVELRFDGNAPTGQVCLPDGEPRTFSGWVGLVSAVESLVREPERAHA